MIKKSELRIGNWFNTLFNDKFKLEELRRDFVMGISENGFCNTSYNDLQPIQISPEILEKIGFEKSIYDIWVRGSFSLDYWEDNKMYSFSCGEESVIVDYLHQLQNLYFALSGEELTITL